MFLWKEEIRDLFMCTLNFLAVLSEVPGKAVVSDFELVHIQFVQCELWQNMLAEHCHFVFFCRISSLCKSLIFECVLLLASFNVLVFSHVVIC